MGYRTKEIEWRLYMCILRMYKNNKKKNKRNELLVLSYFIILKILDIVQFPISIIFSGEWNFKFEV